MRRPVETIDWFSGREETQHRSWAQRSACVITRRMVSFVTWLLIRLWSLNPQKLISLI